MKIYRRYIIALLVLTLALTIVCFIPISASKMIPIVESQVAESFGVEVHLEHLVLRIGPKLKAKTPIMHIMYEDGQKFAQLDSVKFYIPWSSVIRNKPIVSAEKLWEIICTFVGSQDPFALRRQALGIVNLLSGARWSLSISEIVEPAMDLLKITDEVGREKIQQEVADFMRLRIKNVLSNSTRYDVIDAVLDDVDDIFAVTLKAAAVEQFLATPDSTKIIQSFVRVGNLAHKAESTELNAELFTLDAEKILHGAFAAIKVATDELLDKKDFLGALDVLKKLSTPIDSFFDSVMVMDEDLTIRKNRLALLKSIDDLLAKIADFGKIVQ